jgi:hypothetical protein
MLLLYFNSPWLLMTNVTAWTKYLSGLNPFGDDAPEEHSSTPTLSQAQTKANAHFWSSSDEFFKEHPVRFSDVDSIYGIIKQYIDVVVELKLTRASHRYVSRRQYMSIRSRERAMADQLGRRGLPANEIKHLALRTL